MKILVLMVMLLTLAGCRIGALSPEQQARNKEAGEYRVEVFKACMELTASVNKATTQHYNDLDDIVVECSRQASYMTDEIYQ